MQTVVVSIDFGTSRSGYAYAFVADGRIVGRFQWPHSPVPYPKTLTHLLYDPDCQVQAWGFEARKVMAQRRGKDCVFVNNFKMDLQNQAGSSGGPTCEKGGVQFSVIKLVADYLREIKDLALRELSQNTAGQIRNEHVLWCLTVPAMWTDQEKNYMRQAAQRAGLIDPEERDRLLLVLEPEAAAARCMEEDAFEIEDGSTCMVVDSGGGTVDISVLKKSGDELIEVAQGSGGAFGSTYVDQQWFEYLNQRLDGNAIERFSDEHPMDYIALCEEWERTKVGFDPDQSSDEIYFALPSRLYQLLSKEYPHVLERMAEEQEGEDTHLIIKKEDMKGMFQPVINGILKLVQSEFDRLPDGRCDYLFMVGGFSDSQLLQIHLRRAFEKKVRGIIVPPNPGSSIVEGAVLFGLRPQIVPTRVCRMTYGVSVARPFREGVDPESNRFRHRETGQSYCDDHFVIYATKGKQVDADSRVTHPFSPLYSDQTSVSFTIYASDKSDPTYTNQSDVHQIGRVVLPLNSRANNSNRELECTFFFGKTEIMVEAKDIETGDLVDASISYL